MLATLRNSRVLHWAMRHRRQLSMGFITLAVALLVIVLHDSGGLLRAEQISYDMRMKWSRSGTQLHPDIAVVLIDEASLQALDPQVGRFPWPRAVYADVIDFLMLAGARAVVFDILLTEREVGEGDERLASATAESGRVVHAFQLFHDPLLEKEGAAGAALPDDFVARHALMISSLPGLRNSNRFVLPQPQLYEAAAAMGVVDVEPDSDGVYRRLRLFHSYDGLIFPALSTAFPSLEAPPQVLSPRTIELAGRVITLDGTGRALVNQVDNLRPYSFAGVYASLQALQRGDMEGLLIAPEEFADKVVFIGASAVGLADVKATPLSPKAPGVALHASFYSNLLADELLAPAPSWVTPLTVLVMAFLCTAAIMGTGNLVMQFIAPLGLALLYAAWAVWQFDNRVVYEMAAPLAAVVATAGALWAYIAATEGRDKRRVRAMFSQYVSPAVLNRLVESGGSTLQAEIGQAERLSVLFTDIRGFTSISEQLPPAQVVDLLNTHFSVMSEIVFHQEGTLDKFIGDAIMAFWGAPIHIEQHALKSVRAAVEMWRGLADVNRTLQEKGYPSIAIGVGINTGDTILGNIGSARKLDYTAIGDTVNIASRLEGLCKVYTQVIVISEYTRAELPDTIPCALLDLVRVKGKEHPLAVYTPLGLPEDPPEVLAAAEAEARLINGAFSAYRERRWEEAIALYRQLPEQQAGLRELFVSRCEGFMLSPPADDWDGVYVMAGK